MFAVREEEGALDIVQDSMLKLAEKYGDRPAEEFPMLFQRILQNTIRDFYRRSKVRSMWTTDSNHGAQTQFHSGRHQNDGDFPTLGAWVHYGLGTLNEDLPQFISMGNREYWNKKDCQNGGGNHPSKYTCT